MWNNFVRLLDDKRLLQVYNSVGGVKYENNERFLCFFFVKS